MIWEAAYIAGGMVLAAYYVPQLRVFARDTDGLKAYSLPKAAVQLGCRTLMMPFVWLTVDSPTMLALQGIDLALRGVEVHMAIATLRRQGWTWVDIARRIRHQWVEPGAGALIVGERK